MTLTTNGKDYIANTFGISNCYVASGLNWTYTDIDGALHDEIGATAQIISRLVSSLVTSVLFNNVTYIYSMLRTANDNTDVTLTDARWVAFNDGSPVGEAQYCSSAVCNAPITGFVVA